MNDHRSPEEIERDLEHERAALAESLDDLRAKFSIDTLVRQSAEHIRNHSGEIGQSVSRAVKENPLALALTGVGLTWLIFGQGRPATVAAYDDRLSNHAASQGSQSTYWRQSPAPKPRRNLHRNDDVPAWARDVDHTYDDVDSDEGGRLGSVMNSLHDTADAVRDRAEALRNRLSEGTEHLTEEGRARVVAAREKAHEAREEAMSRMADARERAVDLFEEQPLIAGALALAVGAAVGAALPHTRFEDEHFGAKSDELIREAERILSEERAKLAEAMEGTTGQTGASGSTGNTSGSRGTGGSGAAGQSGAQTAGGMSGISGSGRSGNDSSGPQSTIRKGPVTDIPS
jgi:hypothetical protein